MLESPLLAKLTLKTRVARHPATESPVGARRRSNTQCDAFMRASRWTSDFRQHRLSATRLLYGRACTLCPSAETDWW